MKSQLGLSGRLLSRKGEAKPPLEPKVHQTSKRDGRRVATTLPLDTYVEFKAHVARSGITGEQAVLGAIKQMLSRA